MATRTMTVRSGGRPALGWHEVTIKKATFDTNDNDSTFIDVWFNELPETLNMRVYEAFDKQGNEFAVGSVFRFAAPTVFQNEVEQFSEEDVKYWMDRAEGYYNKYVKDGVPGTHKPTGTTGTTVDLTPKESVKAEATTADIPF